MNRIRIPIYVLYCVGVITIPILILRAVQISNAFWTGDWHGSYLSIFMPFILNTHIAIALALGSIPMTLLCLAMRRLYGASKKGARHTLVRVAIWLPAAVCYFFGLVVAFEIAVGLTIYNF